MTGKSKATDGALTLARDVTREECPWLPSDLAEGTEVYRYTQYTYGCISPSGVAVSLEPDGPFLEVPRTAVSIDALRTAP